MKTYTILRGNPIILMLPEHLALAGHWFRLIDGQMWTSLGAMFKP